MYRNTQPKRDHSQKDNGGVTIGSYWYTHLIFIFLLYFAILSERNRRLRTSVIRRRLKKQGEKRKMPIEMLKKYIGEKVTVVCSGSAVGFEGTIVSIEENWIMIEEKKNTRIINGDTVSYITIKKDNK